MFTRILGRDHGANQVNKNRFVFDILNSMYTVNKISVKQLKEYKILCKKKKVVTFCWRRNCLTYIWERSEFTETIAAIRQGEIAKNAFKKDKNVYNTMHTYIQQQIVIYKIQHKYSGEKLSKLFCITFSTEYILIYKY